MPKKSDPVEPGFTPIEIEPFVDPIFTPIEVTPHEVAEPVTQPPASASGPAKSPDAGEKKEN